MAEEHKKEYKRLLREAGHQREYRINKRKDALRRYREYRNNGSDNNFNNYLRSETRSRDAGREEERNLREAENQKKLYDATPGQKDHRKVMRRLAKQTGGSTGLYAVDAQKGRQSCSHCGGRHNIGSSKWYEHNNAGNRRDLNPTS